MYGRIIYLTQHNSTIPTAVLSPIQLPIRSVLFSYPRTVQYVFETMGTLIYIRILIICSCSHMWTLNTGDRSYWFVCFQFKFE